MLIAVLSDVHANLAALSAVLDEARSAGAEELFLLGDYVGYYYEPLETLATLRSWPSEMLRGNHEELLARASKDSAVAEELRRRYGSGHDAALAALSPAEVAELVALPASKTVERGGLTVQLCHGSPWSVEQYVYPDAPEPILERCAGSGTDFVLMGHTHRPFQKRVGKTIVANVGSVGQPRDKGGAAGWALLDTSARTLDLRRTAYDTAPLAREAARRDPGLPYLHEVLSR